MYIMVYECAPRESKYMYAFEERLRLMSDEQASPWVDLRFSFGRNFWQNFQPELQTGTFINESTIFLK
jgi:hypothetical protein